MSGSWWGWAVPSRPSGTCRPRRGCAAYAGRSAPGRGSRCARRTRPPSASIETFALGIRRRGRAATTRPRRSPGTGRSAELGVLASRPSRFQRVVGAGAQEAVRVGDAPRPKAKRVQHREPVEPVVELLLADLEQRRPVAQQHAVSQRGMRPSTGSSGSRTSSAASGSRARAPVDAPPAPPWRCGASVPAVVSPIVAPAPCCRNLRRVVPMGSERLYAARRRPSARLRCARKPD